MGSAHAHSPLKPLPPDQADEDYCAALDAFRQWCEDHRVPFKWAMRQAVRQYLAGRPVIPDPLPPPPPRPCDSAPRLPLDPATAHRLARALQLLRETDDPVSDVARATGFPTCGAMHSCVRIYTGASPLDYRQAHRRPAQ